MFQGIEPISKSAVTRLFVAGVLVIVAGLVLDFAALIAAFVSGAIVIGGPEIVAIHGSSFAWSMVALFVLGSLATAGGGIIGLFAWIGALFNTFQLEDKAWFILLLLLGVFSFGFVAMIAYVVAGPDGARRNVARTDAMLAGPA